MSKLLTVGVLLSIGCAHSQPLIVSGETLVQLGDQFVTVASTMDKALDAGVITSAQYSSWSAFGHKFQATYPLAVSMWETAKASGDATMQAQVLAMASTLALDLAVFTGQTGGK